MHDKRGRVPALKRCITVGVVVVTWEDTCLTAECLTSLQALTFADNDCELELRIAVVDDASSVPVRSALEAQVTRLTGSRITLVLVDTPSGYGACVNRGVSSLRAFECDYIWVLNNDITVDRNALLALVRASIRRPEVAIWGSTVIDASTRSRLECAGGCRYSPLTTRNRATHSGAPLAQLRTLAPESLDYICGAAMFCRTDALEGAGGFAEDYFLYFEEQDLVRRLPQQSAIAWCRDSLVYHRGAASTGAGSAGRSALQQYYENYSTLKFTWRYYPLLLPLVLLLRLLLKPWLFLWRREFHLYRPFGAALLDFCLGRAPRVWRSDGAH